ncbi:unnamed protein product, partial [Amoebophrya sp. A25]
AASLASLSYYNYPHSYTSFSWPPPGKIKEPNGFVGSESRPMAMKMMLGAGAGRGQGDEPPFPMMPGLTLPEQECSFPFISTPEQAAEFLFYGYAMMPP